MDNVTHHPHGLVERAEFVISVQYHPKSSRVKQPVERERERTKAKRREPTNLTV